MDVHPPQLRAPWMGHVGAQGPLPTCEPHTLRLSAPHCPPLLCSIEVLKGLSSSCNQRPKESLTEKPLVYISTTDIFLKFISLFSDSLNVLCSDLHCVSCVLHSFSQKCSVNSTAVCRGRGPTTGWSPRAAARERLVASLETPGSPTTTSGGQASGPNADETFPKASSLTARWTRR